MKLTIELSEDQERLLRDMAARMRVPVEVAATWALNEGLRDPEERRKINELAKQSIADNSELMRRLAKSD